MLLRYFYSLLFYLLVPFAVGRLLWRSRAEPLYRATMAQRFGYVERTAARPIWVHAVSAGETNAAAPMVEAMLDAGYPVLVTTMTPTGRSRVRTLFGDRVAHTYAPWDLPGAVQRFFRHVSPRGLVIVDTELWSNILAAAGARETPVLLVNARLSERSARGYARIGSMTREMLASVAVVACQTAAQGERFKALGLEPGKLVVSGSLKFDVAAPDNRQSNIDAIRAKVGQRRVVLGASTHAGEESAMLDVLPALDGDALLVLAPRHTNRNDEVEALCRRRGFSLQRHSQGGSCSPGDSVLLLDTMGELLDFYAVAEIAFVGGSLVPVGGHNPMEPALMGVPVIMGPHLFNIDEIADRFREADAMMTVQTPSELVDAVLTLYTSESRRREMVANATGVMEQNRGALAIVMQQVNDKIT